MPNYLSPGVYIKELSTGARPIEAVGTSTPGFVGVAPDSKAHLSEDGELEVVAINSWMEFLREFASQDFLEKFKPTDAKLSPSTDLSHGVYGFFLNGGSRCYVINVGEKSSLDPNSGALQLLKEIDDIAIVAAPGYTDRASQEALLTYCENSKDRVGILDGSTKEVLLKETSKSEETNTSTDLPPERGLRPRNSPDGYGAFYFPWITVRDPLFPNKKLNEIVERETDPQRKKNFKAKFKQREIIAVAPSGHIAGIYARSDAKRGVYKAPANEPIRGALGVTKRITRQEQDLLNPKGVNCIRVFPNEGVVVWGARTLAPSSSQWRYLNVRRLFNMIEESIIQSARWIVFEPNDVPLWKTIRRDINAFLKQIWRQGALQGQTPEEAFFVKCDRDTNPQEDVDAGKVTILIGLAPVKPAEFVIFQISQTVEGIE